MRKILQVRAVACGGFTARLAVMVGAVLLVSVDDRGQGLGVAYLHGMEQTHGIHAGRKRQKKGDEDVGRLEHQQQE